MSLLVCCRGGMIFVENRVFTVSVCIAPGYWLKK